MFVITTQNAALLTLCRSFIPPGDAVFQIDGRDRCYGIRAIKQAIEKAPSDLVILLDEDAFILDRHRIERLAEYVVSNNIACLGMCDGGVVPTRPCNPNAMNPFFNIIDMRQVRRIWNEAECLSYKGTGVSMQERWAPDHVFTPGIPWRFGDLENYYCFYFWMKAKGLRMEWLTARPHEDGISTLLNDREGEPFLLHTWFGRSFGSHPGHTARIMQAAQWVAARQATASRSS